MTLADLVRDAAAQARRVALAFPGPVRKDDLPWAVVGPYDADVRGGLERDPRIEDERDRVLIAAVKLAETPPLDEPEAVEPARRALVRAIDDLEQAVLRFGIVNRQAARRGHDRAGAPVSAAGPT